MSAVDDFFLKQQEPGRGCLLFLRDHILSLSGDITEQWKYGMPMYYYKNKMWCYLWLHKKNGQPYIGFVDGGKMKQPELLQEKRARMKILLIDPAKDIPLKLLDKVFKEALALRA